MSGGISILLDNSSGYFPGQAVSGHVLVKNTYQGITTGLLLTFTGRGLVQWTKTVSTRRGSKTEYNYIPVENFEKYCEYNNWLLGNGQQEIGVPLGENIFPFTFTLPPRLPASYNYGQGQRYGYANVEYILTAKIKRSLIQGDIQCEQLIPILGHLDLNQIPAAAQPGFWEKSKSFGCCCCTSEPLTMTVKTDAKGFVPGESIRCVIEGNNASGTKIHSLFVELCEKSTMKAHLDWTERFRVGAKADGPSVEPGATFIWCPEIVVPKMAPTNLGGMCNILSVEYCLKVVAHVTGCAKDMELICPIVIGTVALSR